VETLLGHHRPRARVRMKRNRFNTLLCFLARSKPNRLEPKEHRATGAATGAMTRLLDLSVREEAVAVIPAMVNVTSDPLPAPELTNWGPLSLQALPKFLKTEKQSNITQGTRAHTHQNSTKYHPHRVQSSSDGPKSLCPLGDGPALRFACQSRVQHVQFREVGGLAIIHNRT
jgi:hypothetical protein